MKTQVFTGNQRRSVFVILVFATVALTLLWWGRPPTRDQLAGPEALTDKFEEIVFGRDFRRDVSRVYKWAGSYIVKLDANFPSDLVTSLHRNVAELERLTAIAFRIAGRGVGANVHIRFVPPHEFPKVVHEFQGLGKANTEWVTRAACFMVTDLAPSTSRTRAARYSIGRGVIGISRRSTRKEARSCLLEKLYQGLGPAKNSNALPPSITSVWDTQTELSLNDKLLLRALYDERIKPGMARADAMAVARTVIAELVAAVKARGEAALVHPRYRAQRERAGAR